MNQTLLWRTVYRGFSHMAPKIMTTGLSKSLANRSIHCLCNNRSLVAAPKTGLNILRPAALLQPDTPLLNLTCGFKVKGKLKRRCKDCYFVMRQERLYVICNTHPRHKQMSMKADDKKSWILTHATQSPKRAW